MLDHRPRKLAAVQRLRSIRTDPLERLAELRNREPLACEKRPAAVHRVALRRVPQQSVEDPMQVRLRGRQLETLPREPYGRRGELRPRHRPPAAVRRLEAECRPGHRDGGRARPEVLLRVAVEVDDQLQQLAGGVRGSRNGDEEIEQPRLSVPRVVDEHEAAPARARQRALAHPRRERGRNARIDGVSACRQYLRARLRR